MENRFTTVISGISGKFPDCESVPEFETKLYSGKSFMSLVPDRWPINYRHKYTDIVLPSATGKFKLLKEFDPVVFRMNKSAAECTDALTRKILEPSFEAVMDAGLNPYDLDGRNIGVFMAYDHSDSESKAISDGREGRLYVLGASKTMMSNRVSFALNLRGPSFTFGNDLFGNLTALNEAYESVSKGRVEAAIVGIGSVVQHPMLSVNLMKMNVLSPDSVTRVFDKNANGYGRSDALVILFIQRADDAKRNYASIDFSGFTYYGSNPNSYFNFDENLLRDSIDDLYKQRNYKTTDDISFIEMSACGLKVYDKTESNFIADTFCKNRKSPMLVGSVKSNMGMTDSAGPYVGVIKAILALESGIIAQNQNLNEINDQIRAFAENKLKVVTKATPLLSDKIAVNSIGITGALSQVVLKRNSKKTLKNTPCPDDLPRLVLACARTEHGMENVLRRLEQISFNVEFISMVNDVFCKDMPYHIFRGYSIMSSDITYQKKSSLDVKGNKTRPVWFLFSGMGSQWNNMGEGLLKFPIIAETVKKCDEVLKKVGVDIYHVLTTTDPTIFDNIMHSFVGIITIQIALVEVLKALGIKPDGIIGHSVGENACAYADGCLTLEQAVLSSYARGMASIETKTIRGMMAAVGKGYNQIKDVLPKSIEVACHNSATSCTLSGPTEDVENYVKELQAQKVFAKAVNVANIAYHSKHIAPAAPNLLARLKEVIPTPIKRSPIWVSTSVAESDWGKPLAQYCSAEYLTNNLLNCVMFEEGSKHIPSDALVIEIAPHGLLQAIMKRSLPDTCSNVALTRRNVEGKNIENLLTAIGQMYIHGLDVNVNALYPSIEYPVSRETPSISQLARWHHSAPDAGVFHVDLVGCHSGDPVTIQINNDSEYHYLKDHQINNQVILPASFFMYLAWWVFSVLQTKTLDSHPVVFENVKLYKNVSMSLAKSKKFAVFFQKGSGKFEIVKYTKSDLKKKPTEIMSGILYQPSELAPSFVDETNLQNIKYTISSEQLYSVFRSAGYQLKGTFCGVEEMKYDENDSYAKIRWCNNWVSFLDSLLKFNMFSEVKNKNDLLYTYKIRKLEISTDQISSLKNGSTVLCHKQHNTNITTCIGAKMYTVVNKRFSSTRRNKGLKFEVLRFVSYKNPRCQSMEEFLNFCLQIAVDYVNTTLKKNERDAKLNAIIVNNSSCSYTLKNILKNGDALKKKVLLSQVELASLRRYVRNDESCMLIIDNLQDIEEFDVDASFLLVTSTSDFSARPSKIEENFVQITKQQFLDRIFYLFKKKSFVEEDDVQIESEECSKYHVSKQNKCKLTYIVKQNIDSADLSLMLSETKIPCDSRYLFVMDKEIPHNSSLKKQHVIQDLPVTVLQNGEWGSYRNVSTNFLQFTKSNKSLSHCFEDIQMDSVHIQYLCSDKQRELQNDQINEYGIEYSGVQHTGERIMGLSVIDPNEPISKPDPILKWNVPEEWSLEDAATVPFIYCTVYRMMDLPVFLYKEFKKSILINIGNEGCFCEAFISIALSRNFTVYVTVADEQEAALIRNKFPKLNKDQILNAQECSFHAEVLKMTNGKGVNLVVNGLLNIKDITDSLSCSSEWCYFLQLGKISEWETQDLGLYPFLKSISFVMIEKRISSLLKIPIKDRNTLRTLIENGIGTGEVKPFDRNVTIQGMPDTNNDFSEKSHVKSIFKWVPSNDICRNSSGKLRYDNNRSYIIVAGEKKSNPWFELVDWLISKGARKFIIALDNFSVGPNISYRINRLLNQKKATIILSSSQKADSIQNAENLVQEASRIGPLEAIFFLSMISAGKKIYNMDLAARKLDANTHFVSIFSGGLIECESRRFSGFPAIVIHGNNSSRRLYTVLPQIDEILSQFDNSNSPTLYRFVNTVNEQSELPLSDYLPHDINTLEKIAEDLPSELQFVEVTTRAPRNYYLRDCSPIFIISVLGPRPLKNFLLNLMSPAYCATIGACTDSVMELALKLYKSMNEIENQAGLTLISETWSSPIAFELIKLLERNNRKYKLFLLDGNPLTWKRRIATLGPINSNQFENNLIGQMLNIDPKIRPESLFGMNKPLADKLSDLFQIHKRPVENIFSILKLINSVRSALETVYNYEYKNELLKNIVLLERNSSGHQQLNLSSNSKTYVCVENNYLQFLKDPQIRDIINSGIVYTLWRNQDQ